MAENILYVIYSTTYKHRRCKKHNFKKLSIHHTVDRHWNAIPSTNNWFMCRRCKVPMWVNPEFSKQVLSGGPYPKSLSKLTQDTIDSVNLLASMFKGPPV